MESAAAPGVASRHLSAWGWAAVGAAVALVNLPLLQPLLRGEAEAPVKGPAFQDGFDRTEVGPDWWSAGGAWMLRGGQLWGAGTRNAPLWLAMRLPRDVAIDFTARSETASGSRPGDIKFEIFGNGRDHGSGYVLVFGGWGNSVSVIARQDEHGSDRVERSDRQVEIGRTYRMRVERRGARLRWLVDGEEFLVLDDAHPLEGAAHDRFGFSSWDADVFFDEFRVGPLGGEETR